VRKEAHREPAATAAERAALPAERRKAYRKPYMSDVTASHTLTAWRKRSIGGSGVNLDKTEIAVAGVLTSECPILIFAYVLAFAFVLLCSSSAVSPYAA
jgi:hypothetical protein